jgi:hypothetical protein
MKKILVHGVEMTPLQEMQLSKWLSNNQIALNTLYPAQRTALIQKWLVANS